MKTIEVSAPTDEQEIFAQARVISLPVGPMIGQMIGLKPELKMYVAKG